MLLVDHLCHNKLHTSVKYNISICNIQDVNRDLTNYMQYEILCILPIV